MPIEPLTGSQVISDLNVSYPTANDPVSEGDDHIRGIKNVLKNTFPNFLQPLVSAPADIDALVASNPAQALQAHEQVADPHPQYLTQPEADALYPQLDANGNVIQPAGLGVNQTWQDVTASRAKDTIYTNGTSKPIFLAIHIGTTSGAAPHLEVSSSGQWVGIGAGGQFNTLYGIVPPNDEYRLITNGGTNYFLTWAELR